MIYKFQTNHSNNYDYTDFIEFIPVYDEKKLFWKWYWRFKKERDLKWQDHYKKD